MQLPASLSAAWKANMQILFRKGNVAFTWQVISSTYKKTREEKDGEAQGSVDVTAKFQRASRSLTSSTAEQEGWEKKP